MNGLPDVRGWVVAGHSLGGRIAADLMRTPDPKFAGLVLIGTSHPREFSLAHLEIPVVQVFGTRDTVADADKVQSALVNLPQSTRSMRIDDGDHFAVRILRLPTRRLARNHLARRNNNSPSRRFSKSSGRGFRTGVQDGGSGRGFTTRVQDEGSGRQFMTIVHLRTLV